MTAPALLREYLERTLGAPADLEPAKVAGLPVYLAHAYRTWRTRLFGRDFLLAVARTDADAARSRLTADVDAWRRAAPHCHVVLVLPNLGRAQRTRLVAAGIPFIVPGRQMFVPDALVDLRDHFPRRATARPKRLSAAAQCILLRQLLRRDVESKPLTEVARAVGYSAMTLTNVRDELLAAELCAERAEGRAKPLQFTSRGRALWTRAQPLLRSPVKKTVALGVVTHRLRLFDAGFTALARRTMLGEPRVRTAACSQKSLRRAITERTALVEATEDEPAAQVQAWVYDPLPLTADVAVDPLSLWLSLRDDSDERVQAALAQLLETVSW
jgi:hypothetical protein